MYMKGVSLRNSYTRWVFYVWKAVMVKLYDVIDDVTEQTFGMWFCETSNKYTLDRPDVQLKFKELSG